MIGQDFVEKNERDKKEKEKLELAAKKESKNVKLTGTELKLMEDVLKSDSDLPESTAVFFLFM